MVSDLSNVRTIAVKLKSYPSHQTIREREPKMRLKTKGLTEHPFKQQLDNIHQEEIQYWEELFIKLLERPKKNGSAKKHGYSGGLWSTFKVSVVRELQRGLWLTEAAEQGIQKKLS